MNPEFQVYYFVCQAEAALQPKQLMTLLAECERIGAVVMEMVYQAADDTFDDSEADRGRCELDN